MEDPTNTVGDPASNTARSVLDAKDDSTDVVCEDSGDQRQWRQDREEVTLSRHSFDFHI